MTTTPILGMTEWATAQASPWIAHNLALRYLEFFAAGGAIEDRDETDPSGLTPSDGQAWLIAASATGDWAGKDGQLALYVNTGFAYLTAKEGMRVYVKDEDVTIVFDGTAWGTIGGASLTAATASDVNTGTSTTNSTNPINSGKPYQMATRAAANATPEVIIRNFGCGMIMPDWVRSARNRSGENSDVPASRPRSLRSWISTCSWLILFPCSFMRRLMAVRLSLRPA